MERSNPQIWAATLTPHRSLSRRGFIAIMSLIAGCNFVFGVVFYAIGAWPVIGFCGLDVLLMWLAFRANFAGARKMERIEIDRQEVVLRRQDHGKSVREQRFVRHWVRVELMEDRDLVGRLFLRSHGKRTEIGNFLSPDERRALAKALAGAIRNSPS